MQVTVDYTYLSEYGEDPCSRKFDIPEDTDLAQWVEENFPRDDYGEEGPFNHWNPSVCDMDGNLLYERVDGSLG